MDQPCYKISEYSNAKHLFTNYFDLRISDFYEKLLSIGFQRITIDVVKFDNWLHIKHGDYESKGLSLKDVIISNYGIEAYNFIDALS